MPLHSHIPRVHWQVHLGDVPADTTGRNLADGILKSSLPLLLGSVVASITSAIVLSQGVADSGAAANPLAVAGLSAVPLLAALAPVVAPLLEVAKFAGMSASQIEDTVRLKEPIQVRVSNDNQAAPEQWLAAEALCFARGCRPPRLLPNDAEPGLIHCWAAPVSTLFARPPCLAGRL